MSVIGSGFEITGSQTRSIIEIYKNNINDSIVAIFKNDCLLFFNCFSASRLFIVTNKKVL